MGQLIGLYSMGQLIVLIKIECKSIARKIE